jgi:hypothetical protein
MILIWGVQPGSHYLKKESGKMSPAGDSDLGNSAKKSLSIKESGKTSSAADRHLGNLAKKLVMEKSRKACDTSKHTKPKHSIVSRPDHPTKSNISISCTNPSLLVSQSKIKSLSWINLWL